MNVVVIAPHPDDEAIGCGGALRKHVLAGDHVRVEFLTSGEAGGHGLADAGAVREREALAAAEILGLRDICFWREPDGRLVVTDAMIERLATSMADVDAQIVYVPHPGEMHPDHQASTGLLVQALERMEHRPEIRAYEVWTPLPDMTHIEDVSEVMEVKLAAVRAYESQCAVMRFDDAIEGLNRYRGEFHSGPGGPYAEVFGDLDTLR